MNKILIVYIVFMALVIPVSAANTVSVGNFAINAGETIKVPLWLNESNNIMTVVVNITYDPSVLQVYATSSPGPDDGDFPGGFAAENALNSTGYNQFAGISISGGKNGNIKIGYIHLRAVGSPGDSSPIDLMLAYIAQPGINGMPVQTSGSEIDGSFIINNVLSDMSPPKSISNPSLQAAGSTWLNFTWLNPPDPDYHHVMLYLNGAFKTNITAPQNYYNFTGLTPNTSYELGTHTVDSSGNINETWVNKTARTAPLPGLLSLTIPLKSGWNLISIPLNLTTWELGNESAIGKPMNVTPANCISSLYQYNTTSSLFEKSDHFADWGWYPATGSESFTALEPGRGYWAMAQQDCSLTFTGTAPSDLDISLDTGWNLIGWYSMNEAPLGNESVVGDPLNVTPANSLTSIYRYNTTTALFEKSDHFPDWGWWPATGSEGFKELEPGRGYWVMAQNDAGWMHKS